MDEDRQIENAVELIHGFEAVRDFFGRWPSFHDAEIVELHLDRKGPSWLRVYTAIDGFHPEQKSGTVVFRFNEVLDLELYDFSIQNVVSSINFVRTQSGMKISLGACYGLAGWLEVSGASVELAE